MKNWIKYKYWVWVLGAFSCVNGWHMLYHSGHWFWAGVMLGIGWLFGVAALKDEEGW